MAHTGRDVASAARQGDRAPARQLPICKTCSQQSSESCQDVRTVAISDILGKVLISSEVCSLQVR